MHAVGAPVAFDGARFLEAGATVLIDEDRIVGVEAFGCELPDGCSLTSYDGTLLPGLINAHTHLASPGTLGALERVGTASDDEIDATIGESLLRQLRGGATDHDRGWALPLPGRRGVGARRHPGGGRGTS